MNYINFESAKKIEKERLVLKQAREEILLKAKKNACKRPGSESEHTLNEQNWMLPTVARKLSLAGKKHKQKKLKKSKKKRDSSKLKKKKKRQRRDSSGSSNSSSENELVSGSSTESSSNEDVKERRRRKKIKNTLLKQQTISSDEKVNTVFKDEEKDKHNAIASSFDRCNNSEKHTMTRDSWMTNNMFTLKTFSRDHIAKKPPKVEESPSKYDPTRSDRELNPFWKTTGTGLPKFKKPIQGSSDQEDTEANKQLARDYTTRKRNWKKEAASCENEGSALRFSRLHSDSRASSSASENDESVSVSESSHFFTDQEMNVLGAKLIKAEIMGNSDLVLELKHKLECARQSREKSVEPSRNTEIYKKNKKVEHILLTHTDKHGNNRPLPNIHNEVNKLDFDKQHNGKQNKKTERLGTHIDGKRVRYFVDDDKYDIKKMFEREKYVSSADTNMEFANLACKHNNMNDDIDDIFVDKIRQSKTGSQTKKSEKLRAMHEQYRLNEQLDNCYKCLDSMKMDKKLIVSIGEKVYLALPWHKGLQTGHCIITTTQHVSCSTQTDEDTWLEINEFRKALVRMFATQRKDVIFFEVANKFHRNPHLEIHCVPIPEQKAELAPFYFKKAIEESELEWSVNQQLISLSKKPLRNSVPKGLPYFWVSFGLNDGFAHVIEDQDRFPSNFATEIIGGMLHLESNTWRHPRKEQNIIDKVKIFGKWWEKYDCTVLT